MASSCHFSLNLESLRAKLPKDFSPKCSQALTTKCATSRRSRRSKTQRRTARTTLMTRRTKGSKCPRTSAKRRSWALNPRTRAQRVPPVAESWGKRSPKWHGVKTSSASTTLWATKSGTKRCSRSYAKTWATSKRAHKRTCQTKVGVGGYLTKMTIQMTRTTQLASTSPNLWMVRWRRKLQTSQKTLQSETQKFWICEVFVFINDENLIY